MAFEKQKMSFIMKSNSEQKVEDLTSSHTIGNTPVMGSTGSLKVLNLYAGIGGNRKLWEDVDVTAVEYDERIAAIYKDHFPNDNVIVGDAHEYLLNNYKDFDFIWSSPPCQTHTQLMRGNVSRWDYTAYPDMSLYQEIIWLKNFSKALWVVENVKSYYEPLITPQYVGKHYLWSNFAVSNFNTASRGHDRGGGSINQLVEIKGFSLEKYSISNKRQLLRNCTEPELGLHILDCARGTIRQSKNSQASLFDGW